MSLSSTHKRTMGPTWLSASTVVVVFLAIAIAVGAAALVRVGLGASETSLVPARPGHAKFLELNTTGMPSTASAVEAVRRRSMSFDRFVEINTTGMPALTDASNESVSDSFLYWNVDSFEWATAPSALDEGAAEVTPASGPR
ncbi:MAG TPA: hypothetical protein VF115_08130 [Acidimicrobiia bacterium]